ncbi:MAG: hypothetical protein ACOVQ4_20675 [Flectobacillus sp.]
MRLLFVAILMALAVVSCKQDAQSIDAQPSLVGKWIPTYELYDESTQKWNSIQTLVALPTYEFTADARVLQNDKPAGDQDCCGFIGNKYSFQNGKITFSEFKPCPNISCLAIYCDGWIVRKLEGDILEVAQCSGGIMRYKRVK